MSGKQDKQPAPGGTTMASEVELLSTSVGQIEGKTTLILAFRPNPERSFRSMNFGISQAQARRLFDNLSQLFQTSAFLNESEGHGGLPEQKRNTQNG